MKLPGLSRARAVIVVFPLCISPSAAEADQTASGTIIAANREFTDIMTGPGAKIFAGTKLNIDVTGGNADVNFVHREKRECTWYGKCWYERWIDHSYFDAPGHIWTGGIEWRFVSESDQSDVSPTLLTSTPRGELIAPLKTAGSYNTAYRLQARFGGSIDSNRTTGAYNVRVTVDPLPRIQQFVKYLNNGSFLPSSAEISGMMQLDTWSKASSSRDLLVRALVNYAQVVFPSDDSSRQDEHFNLLEVARSINQDSPELNRALVRQYVKQADYATAGAEIKKELDKKEAALSASMSREVRSELAAGYAQLAGLAEREGSLSTAADFARVDALFSRALEHASAANARALSARILSSRAKILRKSKGLDSLQAAALSFARVGTLLGKSFPGYVVSPAPDGRFLLLSVNQPSRGIVFQDISSLKTSALLEGKAISNPDVRTNSGLSYLDLAADGSVLVDDGGIVSWLTLNQNGAVDLKSIENVDFEEARAYGGGVIGWVRNVTGSSSLQYLHGSGGLRPVSTETFDRANWMMAAASNAPKALLVRRGVAPLFRLLSFGPEGVSSAEIKPGYADREVKAAAIAASGKRMALILRNPVDGKFELHVGDAGGALTMRYTTANPATQFDLANASGLVLSANGRYALVMSRSRLLSIDIDAAIGTPPFEASVGGMSSTARLVEKTFGLDNTGSLVAAFVDEEKGDGYVFRLPYEGGEFAVNPMTYPIANQYLTDGTPIFLQRGNKTFVGLSRAARNEVFVVDMLLGSEILRHVLPAGDDTYLLGAGRFVVYTDQMTSSAIVTDLSTKNSTSISASVDLKDIAPLSTQERARLKPRVFAGLKDDEWFVAWLDRTTQYVRFVSKYVGHKKDSGTVPVSLDKFPKVQARVKEIALKLGLSSSLAGFVFADDGDTRLARNPRVLPLLVVASEISKADRAKVEALPPETKGAVDIPVIRFGSWPPHETMVNAKLTGRVIGFQEDTSSVFTSEGDNFYLYKPGKIEQAVVTTSPGLPGVPGETLSSQVIFSPGQEREKGNLANSSFLFLSKKDTNVSVRILFVSEDGTVSPCKEACTNSWTSEADLRKLVGFDSRAMRSPDWRILRRLVSADRTWFAVVSKSDSILYDGANFGVIDELPSAIPYSIDFRYGHVGVGSGGQPSVYLPLRSPSESSQ